MGETPNKIKSKTSLNEIKDKLDLMKSGKKCALLS